MDAATGLTLESYTMTKYIRKNPAERPDLATLMGHPWLKGVEQVVQIFSNSKEFNVVQQG